MKTPFFAAVLLLAAGHVHAAPVTLVGSYDINVFSTEPCDPNTEQLTPPLGEVFVLDVEGTRTSAIIGTCDILQSLQSCKGRKGTLTFDNVSTGSWTFSDYIIRFICSPSSAD